MSLNKERLKNRIADVLDACGQEENDPGLSKELLADLLSEAIIQEIKNMTITYSGGLIAPSSGGAVTGTLNVKID